MKLSGTKIYTKKILRRRLRSIQNCVWRMNVTRASEGKAVSALAVDLHLVTLHPWERCRTKHMKSKGTVSSGMRLLWIERWDRHQQLWNPEASRTLLWWKSPSQILYLPSLTFPISALRYSLVEGWSYLLSCDKRRLHERTGNAARAMH